MKAILLNGSPRKGNTYTALEAVSSGLKNIDGIEIENIVLNDKVIAPCIACEACKESGACIIDDDAKEIAEKVCDADLVVFASPVYWWGITAQLKLLIDRLYGKGAALTKGNKKIGVIAIGEDSVDTMQYKLIKGQFECIAEYLKWEIVFNEAISAGAADDLKKDTAMLSKLKELWKNL